MASRPNTDANIGFALSQPATVWRLFFEFKRFVLTNTSEDALDRAAQFLSELEFGPREFADELTAEEAEAGIAARIYQHGINNEVPA